MHVAADLNWFLQGLVLAVAVALGSVILVRKAASRYFVVDSNFASSAGDFPSLDRRKSEDMTEVGDDAAVDSDSCAVCGLQATKRCAACKGVRYCSEACQRSHWKSEHKNKCLESKSLNNANNTKTNSIVVSKSATCKGPRIFKPSNKILFPYEEFVKFFNWDNLDYPPCGLLNCGNSCFANVVLQCLGYTRPLVAYLLVKGHRADCQRDDWCFLCEFQNHVERSGQSLHPFSPMNILSRLPNIGGNLGYGKQEDAHEFMRFAIDTMQLVCLDEFGGEKVVLPKFQETTLIQHIFGGRLRSQVICTQCNNVSNQFENMMDLTVEIHGDAGSLEECLDQFTTKEKLHGDNLYKCDGCNAYVMAWKRLTVQESPNILTIALKRFQSGRFGKLNKRVTFPETLDLRPYMSESEDGNDVYRLYAVIVHVDMLNASFFGHYICYIKDFHGSWYRIDDCKVNSVELDEVLSQGAYMLLYSRVCARPSCLLSTDMLKKVDSKSEITKDEPQSSVNVLVTSSLDTQCCSSPSESNEHTLEGFAEPMENSAEPFTSDINNVADPKMAFTESTSSTGIVSIEDNAEAMSISAEESVSPAVEAADADTTSLNDRCTTPPGVHSPESSLSLTVINNTGSSSKTYVRGCLTGTSTKESTTGESCSSSNRSNFPSSSTFSTICEVAKPDDISNSIASSSSMSEDLQKGNSTANEGVKKPSGTKFKPLIQPGFLGKPPQRRSAIRT